MADPRQLVHEWLAAFNSGEIDEYLNYYRDDVELHGYTPEVMGSSTLRAYYRDFLSAFDCQSTAEEILVDGDRAAVRFTARVTQIAPWEGIEPSGKMVTWPVLDIVHFKDDRIYRRYSIQDMEYVRSVLTQR